MLSADLQKQIEAYEAVAKGDLVNFNKAAVALKLARGRAQGDSATAVGSPFDSLRSLRAAGSRFALQVRARSARAAGRGPFGPRLVQDQSIKPR